MTTQEFTILFDALSDKYKDELLEKLRRCVSVQFEEPYYHVMCNYRTRPNVGKITIIRETQKLYKNVDAAFVITLVNVLHPNRPSRSRRPLKACYACGQPHRRQANVCKGCNHHRLILVYRPIKK